MGVTDKDVVVTIYLPIYVLYIYSIYIDGCDW